jgi:hypothetical protein
MRLPGQLFGGLFSHRGEPHGHRRRRPRQVTLSCDTLEGRVTPAHVSIAHHALAVHVHHADHHAHHSETDSTTASTTSTSTATAATSTSSSSSGNTSSSDDSSSSSTSSSSSSSTVAAAKAQLRSDVITIEAASGTTVAQLAAIASAFETLKTDGLTPSSQSALESFENSLVTDYASGTTLTGNSTLLSQFEALYTSSPTTQETSDLTTAYNALAAAVTSSNITSADITTISNDWSALLSAEGSTSTNTYPYFELVTGQTLDLGFGPQAGFNGGGMSGGC